MYIIFKIAHFDVVCNNLITNEQVRSTTSPNWFTVHPKILAVYDDKEKFREGRYNYTEPMQYISNPRTGKYKCLDILDNGGG